MAYDPTEYSRNQKAVSDTLHNTAPSIAAEFSKLDGMTWQVVPYVDDCGPSFRSKLIRADGLAVGLYIDRHTKRVSCSPSLPMMPALSGNGSYANLRDFLNTHTVEAIDAGVAADRYTTKPEAVAKDFHKRVVAKYAAHYLAVLAKIEERKAGWQATRDTAEALAKAHGGQVITQNRGDSIGVYFPGVSLPALEVTFGGRVRTAYNLTMTADQAARVLAAMKGE